jgi:flavodoxin
MARTLIAFYSRAGQNYVSGDIVDLKVGNTEVVANKIQQQLDDADLFKIDTVKDYPIDYMETTEVAKEELRHDARPELTNEVENMAQYDTIILGYPNWWGTMPMAVFTFLESYDFAGKTIIPFCTHEGSGMGHSVSDIQQLCPESTVFGGTAIHGSTAKGADRQAAAIANKVN